MRNSPTCFVFFDPSRCRTISNFVPAAVSFWWKESYFLPWLDLTGITFGLLPTSSRFFSSVELAAAFKHSLFMLGWTICRTRSLEGAAQCQTDRSDIGPKGVWGQGVLTGGSSLLDNAVNTWSNLAYRKAWSSSAPRLPHSSLIWKPVRKSSRISAFSWKPAIPKSYQLLQQRLQFTFNHFISADLLAPILPVNVFGFE